VNTCGEAGVGTYVWIASISGGVDVCATITNVGKGAIVGRMIRQGIGGNVERVIEPGETVAQCTDSVIILTVEGDPGADCRAVWRVDQLDLSRATPR